MPFGIEIEFEHSMCTSDRMNMLTDAMREYGSIVDDASLRGNGGEFVTSVLPNYRRAIDFMHTFMREFNNVMGVTLAEASSPRTSIHIHYSNSVIAQVVDGNTDPVMVSELFSNLALLEQVMLCGFPSRRMNNYAVPEEYTKILMGIVAAVHNGMTLHDAIRSIGDKYSALNVLNMTQTPRRRTIEVRVLPSTITWEEFAAVIYLFTLLRPGTIQTLPFVHELRRYPMPPLPEFSHLATWLKVVPEEVWENSDCWQILAEMARDASSTYDSFSSIPLMLSWLYQDELSHHLFRIRAMRDM